MKKITALLLCLCMLFAFAGCGKKDENKADSEYVKDKGTLVIGITDFQPMDYQKDGEWIGFDADLAKEFAKSLGVEAKFQVLADWGGKIFELKNKNIDCVWNGMTLTDEVKSSMEVSKPYCKNTQVVIVKKEKADSCKTIDDIKGLNFAAEGGSAGEKLLKGLNCKVTATKDQAAALMEVKAGTSEACVIDYIMATVMTGEGTDYADLIHTVELNPDDPEEYVVGFRQGSDLAEKLNTFLADAYKDGTIKNKADTYKISDSIIEIK